MSTEDTNATRRGSASNDLLGAWQPIETAPKRYPLELVCLHSDERCTLMAKGHHDPDEFLCACVEWNGMPIKGWGRVRHGWHRTVPDASGEYRTLTVPAKPHARGAYPTTCIVDDATFDQDS